MNDIERVEKFLQMRKRWATWDIYPNMPDLQRLQDLIVSQTRGIWLFIILILFASRFKFDALGGSLCVCVLGFVIYLFVDRRKNRRLLKIFVSTAIQSGSDLINELKRRNADQTQQDKPAS